MVRHCHPPPNAGTLHLSINKLKKRKCNSVPEIFVLESSVEDDVFEESQLFEKVRLSP